MMIQVKFNLIPIGVTPKEEGCYVVFDFKPDGTLRSVRTYEWTEAGWNTMKKSSGDYYTDGKLDFSNDDRSTYYYAEV